MLNEENYIRDTPKKAVILFHGYGDNGTGMKGLAEALAFGLPSDVAFFCPHGPTEAPDIPFGRKWFPLEFIGERRHLNEDHFKAYFAKLLEYKRMLIDIAGDYVRNVVKRNSLKMSDVVLSGFSQGAFVSLLLSGHYGKEIAGACAFSALPCLDASVSEMAPVQLLHGDVDNVVPKEAFDLEKAFLDEKKISYHSLLIPRMGHEIRPEALLAGQEFIKSEFHRQS